MLVGNAEPIFAADLCGAGHAVFFFCCVEEIGHDGVAGGAGALVVVQGDDLGHARAAKKHGVIVTVAVRLLHDDLVFHAVDGLRHRHGIDVVRRLQAGGVGERDSSRGP